MYLMVVPYKNTHLILKKVLRGVKRHLQMFKFSKLVGMLGHVCQLEAMTWWIQLWCMFQGFFYRFRNMRLNCLGSEYTSHT
nr:hypothetical protein [Tanacetum cinerariifolium]